VRSSVRNDISSKPADRDDQDRIAYPIAALNHDSRLASGLAGGVVGVVRILEQGPRVWYGGRLGVHAECRRHNQIGKGLIWKAVTTANGWGCDRFLATVQIQNVRFLSASIGNPSSSWRFAASRHHLMEADLAYYAPASERRPALLAA
jgi:putative N-acetyltransferase (TIGR04045 family)